MARGMTCPNPKCKYSMYAIREEDKPKGTYVTYRCQACGEERKVFEDKPFNPYEKKS